MSNKTQHLDLENIDKSFEEVQSLINKVTKTFERVTFLYMGRKTSVHDLKKFEKYLELRNLIDYRLYCILYHLTFLLDIQLRFQDRIDKDPFDDEERIKGMILGREQCLALFDSIIFHANSMYDYLANLIEYLYGNKYSHNKKWNGLLNSIKSNSIQIELPLRNLLIDVHNTFINKLYGYRSDVIHRKADSSKSECSIDLNNNSTKLRFGAPKKFCKIFFDLKKLSSNYQLSINYVTIWLIKKCFDIVDDILKTIIQLEELNNDSRI